MISTPPIIPKFLGDYAYGRDNNFNLIRFLAATMVVLSHSYPLTGHSGEPLDRLGLSYGFIAVDVFFIISGFLVTSSFFHRANPLFFFRSRILRIFPALAVCNVVCVFIVGLLFTNLTSGDYLLNDQLVQYLVNNTLLIFRPLNLWLPGVFTGTPFRNFVNGSLWTLPYEMRLYVLMTILSVLTFMYGGLLKTSWIRVCIVIMGIVSLIAYLTIHTIACTDNFQAMRFIPFRLSTLFFIGATMWVLQNRVRLSGYLALLCVAALLVTSINTRLFFVIYTIIFPFLVFYCAYVPGGKIKLFNKLGDYSYGMYIYAFPVQQSIASCIPGIGVAGMFFLAWFVTLVPASISWHFIEKRILSLK